MQTKFPADTAIVGFKGEDNVSTWKAVYFSTEKIWLKFNRIEVDCCDQGCPKYSLICVCNLEYSFESLCLLPLNSKYFTNDSKWKKVKPFCRINYWEQSHIFWNLLQLVNEPLYCPDSPILFSWIFFISFQFTSIS